MNIGYEEDELKPFEEATADLTDQKRIGDDSLPMTRMCNLIEQSVTNWLKIDIYRMPGCTRL